MSVIDGKTERPRTAEALDSGPAADEPIKPAKLPGRWYVYAFAVPSILLVAVFFVAPFLLNSWFAFTLWTGLKEGITWNGFDNFIYLNQLGVLPRAVVLTVVYAVTCMLVQNVVGLSLALAMQRPSRTISVFRALYFIPVLISPIAAGYVWSALLASDGPVNAFLSLILPGEIDYAVLGNPIPALITVAVIDAWKWTGLIVLVYIAGLNAIPRELMEAATIDGANRAQRFRLVQWPLLAPAATFSVVVTLVGAFSAFDVIQATTAGGPGGATTVLNVALYQQYSSAFFGTASALSFVVTVLVILTAVPLVTWLRRRELAL